ncbi:hypothetical protein [Francisella philomiragia]|uniref:hypothetical protein n=1 Tax=Francisella philomiragia TaxID=28110 RepID=UPI0019035290|nr:hypothetical protein [Francisella philomiragia]MBK2266892.1 hypothetical protein [Francisella philomiragia]MBK2277939.1 hypothetical protein [Francisella philomiragia]MBK2285796.1 hypothetical protein [Francisella philomiragia]MBK2288176.1 hypothetical protein [Francisella philomiragia]MBK2289754.1 hypothetical protein [Francisella philomiragia]
MMIGQDNYIFETFLVGIVAISSLVQPELVPFIIAARTTALAPELVPLAMMLATSR